MPKGIWRSSFDNSMNCPDEDSIFSNINGYFTNHTSGTQLFPGVGPVSDRAPRDQTMQGCCRTWIIMSQDHLAHTSQIEMLDDIRADPDSVVQLVDHEFWAIKRLSNKTLKVLRNSQYLFARKFLASSIF